MSFKPAKILLFPLSLIYGIVTGVRNYLFDNGLLPSADTGIPVISVGNITVGGTGKTPHVEYLASILERQFNIAVLSRGYKRKTSGFILAEENSPASVIGDEPAQVKNKFPSITVAVDENRRNGINRIRELVPETDVIILDDAFQHRWIKAGLSIVVTDYNRLFTRDHLLPYGRLREHRDNIRRADLILVTKTPLDISPIDRRLIVREIAPQDNQNLYFTGIDYLDPVNIHTGETAGVTIEEIGAMGSHILLITGIARPEPLKGYLEKYCDHIEHISFGDHHNFTTADIDLMRKKYLELPPENRCIITTEKDSTRLKETGTLRSLFDDNFYYLPISIKFLNNDKEEFDNHIIQYVRKDKANRSISRVERD